MYARVYTHVHTCISEMCTCVCTRAHTYARACTHTHVYQAVCQRATYTPGTPPRRRDTAMCYVYIYSIYIYNLHTRPSATDPTPCGTADTAATRDKYTTMSTRPPMPVRTHVCTWTPHHAVLPIRRHRVHGVEKRARLHPPPLEFVTDAVAQEGVFWREPHAGQPRRRCAPLFQVRVLRVGIDPHLMGVCICISVYVYMYVYACMSCWFASSEPARYLYTYNLLHTQMRSGCNVYDITCPQIHFTTHTEEIRTP